ncbi:anthranilate synthase component I [uncultured Pseudoteredinibacter sp.]|uniref:anthranilate synthase component I n=1 Tax=uncultured Pseudoteredinibacter sp. TaxID=1641701 RepID=UPI002604D80B|nr:anthranilate synthase component I [uncultured Pseudoteredinibacter sp.]
MSSIDVKALAAAGYNRVPVQREVLADLDTPLSSYLKLAQGPYSYLFESVQGGEKWGRYSILGLPAQTILTARGDQVEVRRHGELIESHTLADPLSFVEEFKERYRSPDISGLPMFTGGLVGYFAYDCVRYVEPKLKPLVNEDTIGTPDILLMVSEEILVFDNLAGKIILINHAEISGEEAKDLAAIARAEQDLLKLEDKLRGATPETAAMSLQAKGDTETAFRSSFGEQNFHQAVDKIKDYVLSGDTMQVVVSQRLSLPFEAEPLNLYRALRSLNPSPYMYFLDLGDHHVVGSSPEILARLENSEVTVRPIAGTRRRGKNEEEDLALEQDLVNDPKEIAEHLMLIDLGRNDAGRVSKIGSVKLTDKMVVERYSHVMHITSNVTGEVREDISAMDVLRAALPAGTLSGAPKIRAMEIIDELESEKRGIYGGAVGYLSWNGNMDTAIAIRTAVIKDKTLYVQAGAGVVADSKPELEWKETMNKARAIFRAAEMVL